MSSLYGVVHYIRIFTRYWVGNVRLHKICIPTLYAGIHAFPHDILEKCICRDPIFSLMKLIIKPAHKPIQILLLTYTSECSND